jgi:two-component system, sensor histidine kinase FlrB
MLRMSSPSLSSSLAYLASPEAQVAALDQQSLVYAFASFTEAAASLEHTYTELHTELARLRHELEETNHDLAQSLQENQRIRHHLNRIVEGLPCGVLVSEADGLISIANPESRRLLGIGLTAPLSHFEQVSESIQRLLQRTFTTTGEHDYQCDTGAFRWIAIRCVQLEISDGGSSIFILRDLSEAKRLEQEHECFRRRQALAEMSALLAHEIRNPLGSMELFAGLLAKSELATEERQWVEHLQAGLRTLAGTVNNVLHFHTQPPPDLVPTDLGQLLHSLEEFLRPMAQQAQVRMELVHKLDGVLVAADRHGLEQVVLNLALNAFHSMPGGGLLKVSGEVRHRCDQNIAAVTIADTGPGIAQEDLHRIFDLGFTTRPGSPGLGLAVCKTIMEQHGGSITPASQPGSGTTFELEFPLSGGNH